MLLVINPTYEYLESWLKTLPECFEKEGEIIYDARNQIRIMHLSDGLCVNVKRYGIPVFLNRVVYTWFRAPKARRAYLYGMRLQGLQIPTPLPIAYILEYKNGLLWCSYLITLQSTLSRRFYEFGEGDVAGREHILTAFGQFTAQLHEAGVYHKDYSPGNILFDIMDGIPQFSIVDINRMHFGRVGMQKGCENFKRLWGNPDMMNLIAESYAKARHFDIQKTKNLILNAWRHYWKGTKTHFRLY